MSRTIRFTAQGSSSTFGNFAPGDVLKGISDAQAKHFVDEAGCAEYTDAAKAEPEADAASPADLPAAAAPAPARAPHKKKDRGRVK